MSTGRNKNKPIRPFIRKLMERDGYDTVREAARGWGIPSSTLDNWADISKRHPLIETILEYSERLDIPPAELLRGLQETEGKNSL